MKTKKEKKPKIPALPKEEQHRLVEGALERLDRLAESELDMAQMFIDKGKIEIARRRLEGLLEKYAKSEVAVEAEKLLQSLSQAAADVST